MREGEKEGEREGGKEGEKRGRRREDEGEDRLKLGATIREHSWHSVVSAQSTVHTYTLNRLYTMQTCHASLCQSGLLYTLQC